MNEAIKQKRHWRILPKWILYIICAAFVLVIGNIIINRVIEKKVSLQLQQFSANATIRFSAIHANFLAATLVIDSPTIALKPSGNDTAHTVYARFNKISFSGVGFISILFKNDLSMSELKLENGDIIADRSFIDNKGSGQYDSFKKPPFKNIFIEHFCITSTNVWIADKGIKNLLLDGDIRIDKISIDGTKKSNFAFNGIACNINNIRYASPVLNHTLQIKKLAVDSRKGVLRIDFLYILPQQDTAGNPPALRIETSVAAIEITGIDYAKLADKKLIAEKILVSKCNTVIVNNGARQKTQASFDSIRKQLPEINLRLIRFDDAVMDYKEAITHKPEKSTQVKRFDTVHYNSITIGRFEIAKSSLHLHTGKDFKCNIDSLGIANISMLKDSLGEGIIECRLSKINYAVQAYSKLYINELALSSSKKMLHINDIKIIPQCTKFQLGEKLGHQADYVEASVAAVDIAGLDVIELVNKKLAADKITINKSIVYIFRDRRLTRLLDDQPLPVAFLQSLPVQLRIKALQLTNSSVAYEEFPKDGKETGILKVQGIQLSLSPLVNHAASAAINHLNMHVHASIMGSGTVDADVSMPLSADSEYHVKGAINNLLLTSLNSSAENLGKFHVESGMLNKLDFEFWLNEEKAHGKIIGEYHNLVLEKLKGQDKKIAAVPTFALKNIIIPKNKDKSLPVSRRTGIVRYQNDPTRSFSFYLVKALLSGIRDSFTLGFVLPK